MPAISPTAPSQRQRWRHRQSHSPPILMAARPQSGIAGKITEVGEAYLLVEVAEGVQIKVQKQAVGIVLPKGSLKTL